MIQTKTAKEERETKGIYLGSQETIGNWETKASKNHTIKAKSQ